MNIELVKGQVQQALADTYPKGLPFPILNPAILNQAARLLVELMRPMRPDRVGGFVPGADALIGAVTALSFDLDCPMEGFIVRTGMMGHGDEEIIEGAHLGSENCIALITTVVTDGRNEERLVWRLRELDLRINIVGVFSLIHIRRGARERLKSVGVPLYSALSGDDLPEVRHAGILDERIPDLRDGLKAPQRRLLRSVDKMTTDENNHPAFRKTHKILSFHCNKYNEADQGLAYQMLVRMAQNYSIRYPLIEPLGNFGSIDGNPPADAEYTECRLSPLGKAVLEDITPKTPNHGICDSGTDDEPTVLTPRFPLLLMNGAYGQAIGANTFIPSHNLGELCRGFVAMIDNPDITLDELLLHIPGPDLPIGGVIYGRRTIRNLYEAGRGSLIVHCRYSVETDKGGRILVVTDVPSPAALDGMLANISECMRNGTLQGIRTVADYSRKNRTEVRFGLEDGADAIDILRHLSFHTSLYATFDVLHNGWPETFTLCELMRSFLTHRYKAIQHRDGTATNYRETARQEFLEIAEIYGDPRRTSIVDANPFENRP